MKPSTKIAIASLLAALGDAFKAFAAELTGATPPDAPETPQPETPKTTRKPKAEKPAPVVETTTTATEAAAEEAAEETPTGNGKTYEDMRALIEPLVKNGQGADVKKIIAKYSPEGGLKAMDAKHYAAFEKDLAAIEY